WMKKRKKHNSLEAPWSVYEVHLASWQRPDKNDEESYNTYDQITERLVPYVKEMGFTHVELMPVMEHPFDGSWGYQCTGFFASTSRFGDPQGLMRMVDAFHKEEIGVVLDWVPSHFHYDAHGLFMFDGGDTSEYIKINPINRQHHQDKFAFSMMYYYDENFMLPLSHDEIVHGKSPMLYKMPGDEWQKFANLRLLYSYMWTHPGGKLLFMGD